MMKGKRFFGGVAAVLAVGVLFLLVYGASAWAWRGRVPWGGWGRPVCCWQPGSLTEEQISNLQELRRKYFDEIAPLREELFRKRLELRRLWLRENPNEKRISKLQKEISDLQARIAEKRTAFRLEVLKIVRP